MVMRCAFPGRDQRRILAPRMTTRRLRPQVLGDIVGSEEPLQNLEQVLGVQKYAGGSRAVGMPCTGMRVYAQCTFGENLKTTPLELTWSHRQRCQRSGSWCNQYVLIQS